MSPQKSLLSYAGNHEVAKVDQQPDTNTTNLVINERRKLSVFFSALLSQPGDLLREDETMISKRLGKQLTRSVISLIQRTTERKMLRPS